MFDTGAVEGGAYSWFTHLVKLRICSAAPAKVGWWLEKLHSLDPYVPKAIAVLSNRQPFKIQELIKVENRRTCLTDAWDDIIKFNDKYFPGWRGINEVYYSNAMAGEMGEVCNAVKHRLSGGTNRSNPSDFEVLTELADLFIYMELLVESMGHDVSSLADVIQTKMKKNIERMEKQRLEKTQSNKP